MAAGLRRKDHFDEKLGALNPNIGLPTDIASQIVDSAYFTRFLGADLGDAHAAHTAAEDQERAVKAAAAERGAPLQELRALVEALKQCPPPDPFEGQAAHLMRAPQADIAARLAEHQRGLQEVHRMNFTARQAAAGLEESQRNSFQTLTSIAEQHGAALGRRCTRLTPAALRARPAALRAPRP